MFQFFLLLLLLLPFRVIVCIVFIVCRLVCRSLDFFYRDFVYFIHIICAQPNLALVANRISVRFLIFFIHPDRVPCASHTTVMTILRSVRPSTNHDWYDMLSKLRSSTTDTPRSGVNTVALHRRTQHQTWTLDPRRTPGNTTQVNRCIQVSRNSLHHLRSVHEFTRPWVGLRVGIRCV